MGEQTCELRFKSLSEVWEFEIFQGFEDVLGADGFSVLTLGVLVRTVFET
jgi:hypothetical protein